MLTPLAIGSRGFTGELDPLLVASRGLVSGYYGVKRWWDGDEAEGSVITIEFQGVEFTTESTWVQDDNSITIWND